MDIQKEAVREYLVAVLPSGHSIKFPNCGNAGRCIQSVSINFMLVHVLIVRRLYEQQNAAPIFFMIS